MNPTPNLQKICFVYQSFNQIHLALQQKNKTTKKWFPYTEIGKPQELNSIGLHHFISVKEYSMYILYCIKIML